MGVSVLTACHHLLYSHHPRVQALLKLLPQSLFAPGGRGGTFTEDSPTGSDHSLHSSSLLSTIPDDSIAILEDEEEELGRDGKDLEAYKEGSNGREEGPTCPSCPPAFKPCRSSSTALSPEPLGRTSSYPFVEAWQERKVRFVHDEEEGEGEEGSSEVGNSLQGDTSAVCRKASLRNLAAKVPLPPAGKMDVKSSEGSPLALTRTVKGVVAWSTTEVTPTGSGIDMNDSLEHGQEPPPSLELPSGLKEGDSYIKHELMQPPVRGTRVPNAGSPSQHSIPHSGAIHFPVLQDKNVLMLKKTDLHSSSVFSSTAYGPIFSAAQSTTLLGSSVVSLHPVTPSQENGPAGRYHQYSSL